MCLSSNFKFQISTNYFGVCWVENILKAIDDIRTEQFIDFIELSIKAAWVSLGEILGEVKDTDLLDELFSKFCLGKWLLFLDKKLL